MKGREGKGKRREGRIKGYGEGGRLGEGKGRMVVEGEPCAPTSNPGFATVYALTTGFRNWPPVLNAGFHFRKQILLNSS